PSPGSRRLRAARPSAAAARSWKGWSSLCGSPAGGSRPRPRRRRPPDRAAPPRARPRPARCPPASRALASPTSGSPRSGRLLRGRLAALAARGLLLCRRPALLRRAAGAGALAAPLGRAGRVGDTGRPLLRHALVLQGLVLLLVLHRHRWPPPSIGRPRAGPARRASAPSA